jgi:hypothetical protein
VGLVDDTIHTNFEMREFIVILASGLSYFYVEIFNPYGSNLVAME